MNHHISGTVALLLISGSAAAETYLVHPNPLMGDFPNIQAAIDYVGDGDIIELADGYFMGEGNRDIDYLSKEITIRSQSGNPLACVVYCAGYPDDHFGFIIRSVGSGAVLEGITVRDAFSAYGGAIDVEQASPVIMNCIFEDNYADMGGGVLVNGSLSHPTIDGCTFINNRALSAGGGLCI